MSPDHLMAAGQTRRVRVFGKQLCAESSDDAARAARVFRE